MASSDVDLRALIASVGHLPVGGANSSVDLRDHDGTVTVVEDGPQLVSSQPGDVAGWIDGVQASRPLTWRQQRPVQLSWAAAGAVDSHGTPVVVNDRLWVGCGSDDEDYANDIAHGADVCPLPTNDPMGLARELLNQLASERETLERGVCSELASNGGGLVICDGPIVARTRHPRVVGVVKTHATRYLDDHTSLYKLKPGWRSAAFKIESRGTERYSSYIRLHDADSRWWDFAMIRVETFDVNAIDPLAAVIVRQRQHEGSRDGRWDRHLAPIRWVEDCLRGRRPPIFN